MNKAQRKVLSDIERQKDEARSMREDTRLEWKIRGYAVQAEYWCMSAYSFPIAILLWFFTQNFWMALAFYLVSLVYHFSGNLRGLFLHIENYIEWRIKKNI